MCHRCIADVTLATVRLAMHVSALAMGLQKYECSTQTGKLQKDFCRKMGVGSSNGQRVFVAPKPLSPLIGLVEPDLIAYRPIRPIQGISTVWTAA